MLQTFIRLLSCFIPVKSWRKNFRNRFISKMEIYAKQNKKYKKFIKVLRKKIKNRNKIRVGFFVVFDSVFPARKVFELMLKDELFDPYIVIIPDTSRGEENMFYQMDKSYEEFIKHYPDKVYCSYNKEDKNFENFSDKFDIICSANPYDNMTDKIYGIKYNAEKALIFYINYGCMPDFYAIKHLINLQSLNLCWKVFVDTKYNFDDLKKHTDTKGDNAVLSGYAKMDLLPKNYKLGERKRIIIAPHHTVGDNWNKIFGLSNFLRYSDLFLQLPKKYPQIDWIFRPHPVLMVTLKNQQLWPKEQIDEYITNLTKYKNVEYQNGGDYFETFANSDAIIHDCSSFMVEWLYTEKPGLYMLRNEEEIAEIFADLGKACLKQYYKAFNEEQIIDFIENIVLKDQDPMKEERCKFSNEKIKINYPNASKMIIETIKEALL